MADAPDSKSGGGNSVWVQLPPPAPLDIIIVCDSGIRENEEIIFDKAIYCVCSAFI